jgi:sulfatase maturation enzyme AslB (radical SAM superfamily)
MVLIRTHDWFYTPAGEPRGYIDAHTLRELWFHTGTACNLACPFCLEGSSPADDRLQRLEFDEAKTFIDEALTLGVEQFSFTGGEPFVVKSFVRILDYASQHRPCLVLTNATKPLLQRMAELQVLKANRYPVSFRVSIDYPDASRHDAGRGEGSFELAMQGLQQLHAARFPVSVARQMKSAEDVESVMQAYRALFAAYDLPDTLPMVAFPEFLTPFSQAQTPQITESCMTTYQTAAQRNEFMCAFSRMVVKQNGRLRVYACTLVDDDPAYDLGDSLTQSLKHRVMLKHHRCFSCFRYGASCSEL